MNRNRKAIVIGAGRSFWDTDIIERIADSNFQGHIVCSDRIAKNVIDRGVRPDVFKFSVVSIEAISTEEIRKFFKSFYFNDSMMKFRKDIMVYLSCNVDPYLSKQIMFYYNTEAFHRMYKDCALNIGYRSPVLNCGGNVGLGAWNVARVMLGCDQIATLGLDFEQDKHDHNVGSDFPKWEVELNLTKKEIARHAFECSTFNLTLYGLLEGQGIIRCHLKDFFEDRYVVPDREERDVQF